MHELSHSRYPYSGEVYNNTARAFTCGMVGIILIILSTTIYFFDTFNTSGVMFSWGCIALTLGIVFASLTDYS